MDLLVVKAFTLHQQMLSAALRGEWDGIVHKLCFAAGWIDDNEVASTSERGQDWDTITMYKRLYLLTVSKKDAAECHHLYMNVAVKKPYRMPIKSYHKRLKEIDALATSLPCLKDQSDFPLEIEYMNVSLEPVNMCNLLIHSILAAVEDYEYNCMTDLILTDPRKIAEKLSRIEIKLKLVTSEIELRTAEMARVNPILRQRFEATKSAPLQKQAPS